MASLLKPISVGDRLPLRNRVVMSSMTRNRCIDDFKPGQAQVKHYADRARGGTGLIVGEGTFIDWTGCDWPYCPVLINDDHVEAWRKVTQAVHQEGGKIFFQAWHAGRCQHDQMPIMKEKGTLVLAPSNIKAEAGKYRHLPGSPGHTENIVAIVDPRELVETYGRAAGLAKRAGFDGVELLAQGGYLPHQFLNLRANKRADPYGGSIENRCRFILEVVDTISDVFDGPELLCVKINPTDFINDSVVTFEEMKETYTYLIKELVLRKVGIINISRRGTDIKTEFGGIYEGNGRPEGYPLPAGYDPVLDFGRLVKYPGSPSLLMANQDYTVDEAHDLITEGKLDLISFGRPFICNPDLIARIERGIPLAQNDRGAIVYYGPYKVPDENYNDWATAV